MGSQVKDSVRRQFGQNAGDYRDAAVFAQGEDLRHMLESVAFTGTEKVLDLGSGAGHTALKFAPRVSECIGCDLTAEMVEVATELARTRKIGNVTFQIGDAEDLGFPDASFDLVTCRFAAHHFADRQKAIGEIARVLKPKGIFLLVDQYAPEDPALDAFINEIDRMRDPSHMRAPRLSEYHSGFRQAGLRCEPKMLWDLTLQFANWVDRARTSAEMKLRIAEFLRMAEPEMQKTFRIQLNEDGSPVSFILKCALLHGVKAD